MNIALYAVIKHVNNIVLAYTYLLYIIQYYHRPPHGSQPDYIESI